MHCSCSSLTVTSVDFGMQFSSGSIGRLSNGSKHPSSTLHGVKEWPRQKETTSTAINHRFSKIRSNNIKMHNSLPAGDSAPNLLYPALATGQTYRKPVNDGDFMKELKLR